MIIQRETDILRRDRLLLIGDRADLLDLLRQRYPDWTIGQASNLVEGVDDLTRGRVRAVIACVDADQPRLAEAVAGLREAAGDQTRVILCCEPEAEPAVRRVLAGGADEYVLLPPDSGELDEALGVRQFRPLEEYSPAASMDEIKLLAGLLESLGGDDFELVSKLADLIRCALGSESATLVIEGTAVSSGGTVLEPVLMEPIRREGRTIGQIMIGGRSLPYQSADLEKLSHYATLAAHLLAAADAQRQWRREAFTDEVSGLHNRRYALRFIRDLLERAREERFRVTVLLFDIDNFKSYNDDYGHDAGDEVIQRIGQLFQNHCREHDLVTRYGGDEFCVIFWDADQPRVAGSQHPSDALAVLARFKEALRNCQCESLTNEPKGALTISGGLASYPWDGAVAEDLIARADEALLRAKRAGKNQVFMFAGDTCAQTTSPDAQIEESE